MSSEASEASARRARRNVVLTAAIAGLGGLLFGYDTGIIAGALLFIKTDFGLGCTGAFWLYAVIGLFTLAFCWKLVPETKGKQLEEIEAYFQDLAKGKDPDPDPDEGGFEQSDG
jgi:hypothetical protein